MRRGRAKGARPQPRLLFHFPIHYGILMRELRIIVQRAVSMHAIQATFHNGVFAPKEPVKLPEGAEVTLWVQPDGEIPHLRPEDRALMGDPKKGGVEGPYGHVLY